MEVSFILVVRCVVDVNVIVVDVVVVLPSIPDGRTYIHTYIP